MRLLSKQEQVQVQADDGESRVARPDRVSDCRLRYATQRKGEIDSLTRSKKQNDKKHVTTRSSTSTLDATVVMTKMISAVVHNVTSSLNI